LTPYRAARILGRIGNRFSTPAATMTGAVFQRTFSATAKPSKGGDAKSPVYRAHAP
jgi:hypothetical protein